MRLSRRTLVLGLAGTTLAGQAATKERVSERRVYSAVGSVERRVYSAGSVLPAREVLDRNGIRVVSVRHTQRGTEYLIPFDSLESRCKAWDRFNSDPAWCAIRDAGNVALKEIRLYPGLYPGGKIFEISL